MERTVSVIILTKNEELNLPRCLESIRGVAREVIIVDSFSTDRTIEIAKKFGAKVFQREFKNQAEQFNWALDNLEIGGDWILRLDADEYLTPKLAKEISEAIEQSSNRATGYYIKRRVIFMGRWIKHGGYYPVWFLRLWRKGAARYEEREMDEHAILLEGAAEKLKNDFVDDNGKGLEHWLAKHNDYSSREARARLRERKDGRLAESFISSKGVYSQLPFFWRAFVYFVYRYIFRLGFLDGKEGLIFHFLQGFWYRFAVDAKIFERRAAGRLQNR